MGGAFSLVPVWVVRIPSTGRRGQLIRHHIKYGQSGQRVQMKKPRARRGESHNRKDFASRVFSLGKRSSLPRSCWANASAVDHPTDSRHIEYG